MVNYRNSGNQNEVSLGEKNQPRIEQNIVKLNYGIPK